MSGHRFEYWFHPAAVLSISTLDDLKLRDPKLSEVAAAFLANLDQVAKAAMAPLLIVVFSRAQQAVIDQACLEVFGDLANRSADDPKKSTFDEAVARHWTDWHKQTSDPTNFGERIFLAAGELDQLQKIDIDIRKGLEATLRGMVTGIWTAFEVMAADLWEASLNANPSDLASLKGSISPLTQTPKRAFSAFPLLRDDKNDSSKMIRLDFLQTHGFDLSKVMGNVLRERFNFQVLDGIRTAYLYAFHEKHAEIRRLIADPSLTALACTRNVLVHRAGIADENFMRDHSHSSELQSLFPNIAVGEKLKLTGLVVHNLVQPVITVSLELLRSTGRALES